MNQRQSTVIIDELKIKEAQCEYEKIKARCQIDEQKLQGYNFVESINLRKNSHRVLFPVTHKDCLEANKDFHICGCLAQVLSNKEEMTKCGQLSLMQFNNLQIPSVPYFAVLSVHQKTDLVSIMQGFVLNKILRQRSHYNIFFLENPQQLFREIMKRNDARNNFTNRVKIDQRYNKVEGFEFYAACLLDWVKLNIPMRFKSCNHIECFDFTSIVFKIENEILKQKNVLEQDRKYSKIICGLSVNGQFCPSQCVASYDKLIDELVVDYELMDAIRKSEYEAFKFVYTKQKQEIFDEFTYSKKQQNSRIIIKSIDQIKLQSNNLQLAGNYSVIQFINLRSKSVLKQAQLYKYSDINISLICPLSNQLIQYPARCLKCPQQQCADLKSLLQYVYDSKMKDDSMFFQCPLCKFRSQKRYLSLSPFTLFYFDDIIMGIIMEMRYYQNNLINLNYKDSQIFLNEYKKQRILKTEILGIYPQGKVLYSNLICCLSGGLLEDPLIIKDCEQKLKMSFQQFYQLYKAKNQFKDQPFQICDCKNCISKAFNPLEDLFYDEMLSEILSIYLKFNELERQQINIQQEIIYNYNTKVVQNLKQTKIDILGLVIQHSEIHTSIQNVNKLENKFAKIAMKDQFKKWNIQIQNLNIRINKVNTE